MARSTKGHSPRKVVLLLGHSVWKEQGRDCCVKTPAETAPGVKTKASALDSWLGGRSYLRLPVQSVNPRTAVEMFFLVEEMQMGQGAWLDLQRRRHGGRGSL